MGSHTCLAPLSRTHLGTDAGLIWAHHLAG